MREKEGGRKGRREDRGGERENREREREREREEEEKEEVQMYVTTCIIMLFNAKNYENSIINQAFIHKSSCTMEILA